MIIVFKKSYVSKLIPTFLSPFFRVDTPTEKRVRKWEISLEDLVVDPLGKSNNRQYLK